MKRRLVHWQTIAPGEWPYLADVAILADYSPDAEGRIREPLDPRAEAWALKFISTRPRRREISKRVDRAEYLAEVWAELVNPPAECGRVEDLETRVTRAIWRAEQRIRRFEVDFFTLE